MARARYRLATNSRLSMCIVMLIVLSVAMYQLALDLKAGCLGRHCSEIQHDVDTLDTAYESGSKIGLIDHAFRDLEDRQADILHHEHAFSNNSEIDRSHNTSLETRQAPWDDVYKKATKKGEKFICWMKDPASAGNKAIPKFTKYSDIEAQGWTRKQETVDYTHVTDGAYKSMIEMIGTDLSDGIKVRFDHNRDVGNYPATNGEYVNVYWPNHGIILANDNYGPEYQVSQGKGSRKPWKDARGKPLPIIPLRQWSDLISLEYTHLSSTSSSSTSKPLKFIFRRNIQNKLTQSIIDKALKKKGETTAQNGHARPWPGHKFVEGDEGFEALLDTPNTSGICWMLIQHAEWWARKEVKSIRVWWDGKGAYYTPNLMVEIGNVED